MTNKIKQCLEGVKLDYANCLVIQGKGTTNKFEANKTIEFQFVRNPVLIILRILQSQHK